MATGGADVNLGIDIEKKGKGDVEAASGLELVAKAADNAKDELAQLDRKLVETRLAMVAAGKEFAKTGDISPFKQLLKDERQLSQVSKTLSRLTGDLKKDLGKGVESGIVEGGQSGLRALGPAASSSPYLAIGIASAIVAATPAIAGALAGAVAAGGIGAGVLIASKDARTRQAWAEFGKSASEELTSASSPFVGVLNRGADTFKVSFDKILPTIKKDFADLAPVADRLFVGVAGFVEKLTPGLDALTHAGIPVLNMLSQELPRAGAAISTAFKSIASAGQGGAEALRDLLRLTEATIISTGKAIEVTERWYLAERAVVQLFAQDTPGAINSMAGALTTTKNANLTLTDAIQGTINAITKQGDSLQATTAKMANFTAQALAAQDSELALKAGLLNVADALKASNGSLDTNTRLGLAARDALQAQINEIARQRQNMLDQGLAIAYVNDWTQKQIDAEYADARAHGANKAELDKLIGQWEYMLRLNSTKELTTTFKTLYVTEGSPPPAIALRGRVAYGLGGIIPAAARGLIANGPVLLGERTVPEAAIPAPNSGISQARADALLGTAASWWGRKLVPTGGGGTTINVTVNAGVGTDGAEVGRQVAQIISRQIRTDPAFAATIAGAST